LTETLRKREADAERVWSRIQGRSGLTEAKFAALYARVGSELTWRLWEIALSEASEVLRRQEAEYAVALARTEPGLHAVLPTGRARGRRLTSRPDGQPCSSSREGTPPSGRGGCYAVTLAVQVAIT
jgi:hypothetical protein